MAEQPRKWTVRTKPVPVGKKRRWVSARTDEILRRCYRGEAEQDVLDQAMVLKATADGHLDAAGRIKTRRRP